jgi:glycosyltransferase involved in cell wall biosynthesis
MARYLPEFGYSVEVVAAEPDGSVTLVDPGLLETMPRGTTVHRSPVRYYLGRNPSVIPGRGRPLSLLWWKLRAHVEDLIGPPEYASPWAVDARRVVRRLFEVGRRFDVILVSGPPFAPAVEAIEIGRHFGVPVVTDFRDLWVTSVMTREEGGVVEPVSRRRLARLLRLERRVVEHSALSIFNNREAMRRMLAAYPALHGRCAFVTNAYEPVHVAPSAGGGRSNDGALTLVHAGQLSYGRTISAGTLLRAAGELRRSGAIPPIRVLFVGEGADVVSSIARAARADDIAMPMAWMTRDESISVQRRADMLVVLQADIEGNRYCVPAKLFEYMSSGKCILGVLPDGPAKAIILEEDLGEVGGWNDVESVKTALLGTLRRVNEGRIGPPPTKYRTRDTMRELAGLLDGIVL